MAERCETCGHAVGNRLSDELIGLLAEGLRMRHPGWQPWEYENIEQSALAGSELSRCLLFAFGADHHPDGSFTIPRLAVA